MGFGWLTKIYRPYAIQKLDRNWVVVEVAPFELDFLNRLLRQF